ncbi:MAG: NUDIX hydrolase [Anaerolineae bacterium]|jgi:ADP-ribose pyrophosphatase YjhB (NUDIX family)
MKREYPSTPIVAVGVIIRKDDCIALIKRSTEPSKGLWTFPGGAVELGESLQDAARREAWEETGLHVQVGRVVTVIDNIVCDETGQVRYHYIIVDYLARPTGGTLRPDSDVSDVCWARLSDVETLDMTEKAQQVARKLLTGRLPRDW